LHSFLKFIDKTSETAGKLVAWLIIPLVLGLMYEVIARYVFNAPTIWAYDITYMIYGAHFMMGAAYLLYVRGYVRIDVRHAGKEALMLAFS
jgi:TRAP-type mannitol/chloroaromatic compound transport system permease small subunit